MYCGGESCSEGDVLNEKRDFQLASFCNYLSVFSN